MPSYNPQDLERRWQDFWVTQKTFRTPDSSDKPKYYILDMFPYPSGSGLHVGHPEGYTATDILARYKRMLGFNVLHPMGWDAFGLPAEQYAIETGTHPRATTERNVDTFRRQIQMLGFSYDWDREVDTTDPDYFRWTQWIFLQLYDTWYDPERKQGRPIAELPIPAAIETRQEAAIRSYRDRHRLAYQAEVPVNWCPALGTVLANEEVIDGQSERGQHPVVRMPLKQWMLRITAYAERLLDDLEQLEWSPSIKEMQRNWIGKSEGAEVDFLLPDRSAAEAKIRVFTTRPDTLFGATYMVLAPEHPLVEHITTAEQRAAVHNYCAEAARKSDFERTELAKKKTGVFTGAHAINPLNQERIPVWIADYVLASYGTGAIMAVPAHDERDFEFATQFGLPIKTVVRPPDEWLQKTGSTIDQLTEAFTEDGVAVHSGSFNGLSTGAFKNKITAWLEEHRLGTKKVNYKLRDWLFSRQRYWGEPFPLLHEIDDQGNLTGAIEPLDPSELPLRLPVLEDYKPSGRPEPPLGKATDWLLVTRNGKRYRRETNTMPQWAGSCWYYLRYIDPRNKDCFCAPAKEQYWMPVDLYVGGAEHAVLHLLYARFWHKVLFDRGHVHTAEPFQRLVNQGMILGENNEKMSKSRGNVINPDDVVSEYGADSLRLYEMFMGPLEAVKPWSMRGVEGVYRFLGRVWRLFIDERAETLHLADTVQDVPPERATLRMLHRTIRKVTEDLDNMRFNTAIAAMMELTNHLTPLAVRPKQVLVPFILLLGPFAPHVAEELWHALGHKNTLAYEPWPKFDAELTKEDEVEVVVQLNGKIRLRLMMAADLEGNDFQQAVLDNDQVKGLLAGKTVKKVIAVPGKLVNIVVG